MDPNANLELQLVAAREIVQLMDAGEGEGVDRDSVVDAAERLAGNVLALHEWLTTGGFFPVEWVNLPIEREDGLTRAQALTFGRRVNPNEIGAYAIMRDFSLPSGYVLVNFPDGFQLGIAPDGAGSS